ncbi:ubiquinone anaerobic biosynthesis accessory factor UbiT [Teredinibacter haidensis]|uniref:ubiquinone anaerobic biosynthesis accessory factor UbiT n=1 Tax=Teredinibacter haidensis TaxID=2731755 RepID=UPI000948BFFB|nr:SCP2 sterol-binding domain-containing protein [Teredinibacter haidensis]
MSYQQRFTEKAIDTTPLVVSKLLRITPLWAMHRAIESALNQLFRQAIDDKELDFFQHKILYISVDDIALNFYLSYAGGRFKVLKNADRSDVQFTGNSHYFFLMATQKTDPDMLFFRRKLCVTGDTDLGLAIKNFLACQELSQQLPSKLYSLLDYLADEVQAHKV